MSTLTSNSNNLPANIPIRVGKGDKLLNSVQILHSWGKPLDKLQTKSKKRTKKVGWRRNWAYFWPKIDTKHVKKSSTFTPETCL